MATQGQRYPFASHRLQLSRSRTPSAVEQWFEDVLTLVEKHQAALQPLFSSDPVGLTRAYAQKLKDALVRQALSKSRIPALTKERRAVRIALAAAMQQQRFAAAFAFAGNKVVLQQFVPAWEQRRLWKKARKHAPDAGADPTGAAPAEAAEAPVTEAAPAGHGR